MQISYLAAKHKHKSHHIRFKNHPSMELPSPLHPLPWQYLFPPQFLFPHNFIPPNHVHWTQTPESHIFSADIPGVRKEELRVEVEDSRYLIIRTEAAEESTEPPARKFVRKFRLPARVDLEAVSAGYEHGVLTVTVPRSLRRGFLIEPSVPDTTEALARAA
ncbi:15.4 kDa class V heat shock protein-like [Prosopis cineraria]|uniref:15.4 kDa class V heat shock protein-like n=1 Tax=Prosopis cineraria TaxID=364024 RepID=UPI00240FF7F0|nr:15.4 kDa class V heat shock protein-like [Prosopis cineraria]